MNGDAPSDLAAEALLGIAGNLKIYQRLVEGQSPLIAAFWKYLLLCFETPRPSTDYKEPNDPKRLDQIRKAVSNAAKKLGAEVIEEESGSLLLRREGRGAGAGKPWLCLQGHLDMVCSQNEGAEHDFEKDGIEVRFSDDDGITDGWLKPLRATTLGADNGVSIAACLAVLEALPDHPPLEMLLTSNEETDFSGAEGLKPGTLRSKQLLNLDSEEEYSVCVGCAGGFEHSYKLPVERGEAAAAGAVSVAVALSGLHGGHSGVDIHREYGNANKILARLMLQTAEPNARLAELSGGTGPTAIPREASCIVLVPEDRAEGFCEGLQSAFAEVRAELLSVEPTMEISAGICPECAPEPPAPPPPPPPPPPEADDAAVPPPPVPAFAPPRRKGVAAAWKCSRCPKCQAAQIASTSASGALVVKSSSRAPPLTSASTAKAWDFIANVPHGVLRMSTDVPGLVESSISFGILELREDHLFCHVFLRSSVNSYMQHGQRALSALGRLAGAENIENQVPFPAWQPRMDSPLLALLKRTHAEQFEGKEPRVYAIHAGLECGILMQSHPDLDCCSIGPWICNAHSPDERVNIASGIRYVQWLRRVLESLAKGS